MRIIKQIDKNTGEIINTFSSYREAAIFLGKPGCQNDISRVCRGIRHTAYGFKWELEEENICKEEPEYLKMQFEIVQKKN